MAITVTIPTALRQYTNNQSSVAVEGDTVASTLRAVVELHPDLGKHIYTEQGKLRSFVNIYLGDEDIRYLDGEETTLQDGETLSIIPAIAGGRG